MKRSILLSVLLMAGAVTIAVVAGTQALFTDTQTASGDVNAAGAGSIDLRINDNVGADDSGDDEIIFETTEDLLPGESASNSIALVNAGTDDFDVVSFDSSGSLNLECDADNPGDDFTVSVSSPALPFTITAGNSQSVTVTVTLDADADNDCQNAVATAIIDVNVASIAP